MLSFYGIIPEGVYSISSVSTLKTNSFETPLGNFTYAHLQPYLFFGYGLATYKMRPIKIAKLEKAILDYLYLHSNVKTIADFESLRWNKEILRTELNPQTLATYLQVFRSKALNVRIETLKTYYA